MMIRHGALILALVFVVACGGDDENGTPAGAGGSGGVGGGSGGGSGGVGGGSGGVGGGSGGMSGTTGGAGGMTGGMGGMTGGMGGSGGTEMDDDGGVEDSGVEDSGVEDSGVDAEVDAEVDAGADAGPDAGGNTGEEGAQNGPCRASDSPCDDGLGCYAPSVNLPGFCTLECTDSDDCSGLSDATWTCSINVGLCRVECDRSNGNEGCPEGFECADVLGNDRCVPMD